MLHFLKVNIITFLAFLTLSAVQFWLEPGGLSQFNQHILSEFLVMSIDIVFSCGYGLLEIHGTSVVERLITFMTAVTIFFPLLLGSLTFVASRFDDLFNRREQHCSIGIDLSQNFKAVQGSGILGMTLSIINVIVFLLRMRMMSFFERHKVFLRYLSLVTITGRFICFFFSVEYLILHSDYAKLARNIQWGFGQIMALVVMLIYLIEVGKYLDGPSSTSTQSQYQSRLQTSFERYVTIFRRPRPNYDIENRVDVHLDDLHPSCEQETPQVPMDSADFVRAVIVRMFLGRTAETERDHIDQFITIMRSRAPEWNVEDAPSLSVKYQYDSIVQDFSS